MKKQRIKSVENARTRVGYTFVIHWIVGYLIFFFVPFVSSIWYGFNEVIVKPGNIETKFIGIENFHKLIAIDPDYIDQLTSSIGMMFYSLPVIISISLILAVLLNQNFKGRTVFRVIFFLPVLLANSVVLNMLNSDFITLPLFTTATSGEGLINYSEILSQINMPTQIGSILKFLLSNTIDLIWKCGVQTILFLAGLQSIPDSLYEVSKIEGANKWEEFWLITVPSLRNIISLVLIYTMIELFADMQNTVVSRAYERMTSQDFGESSAMIWIYFSIVILLVGTVYALYQRYSSKHWE